MPKGYIVDIAPLTRLPLSRQQYFSYLWDTELSAGTLVDIPLFRRNVQGVVLGSRLDFERLGNIKLKKINKVVDENFLTDKQLELAHFISEYYFAPLGLVLKFFTPKRVKSRKNNVERIKYKKQNITLTPEQTGAVDKIVNGDNLYKIPNTKYLLFGPAASGKTEVYINAIAKFKLQNPNFQFLVLLPELTLTSQAVERYGHLAKPEEIVLIHSKISKGQLWSAWQKIRSGEARIIIGTRMAVFAPFQNLKLIVVDEEQDISFKQWDMAPKYDARKVAEKLAELFETKIVFGSATPSIETYQRAIDGDIKLLKLPKLDLPNTKYQIPDTKIDIVDMKKERWRKNRSVVSRKLKGELEYVLKNKLQAVLFINRQGMSAFSVCQKCRTVMKCPQCDRALVYDDSGTHHCLHCRFRTDAFPKCAQCQGMEFRSVGIGTQKVEREVQSFFPGARILRIDSSFLRGAKAAEKAYSEFAGGRYDILIGTQMITKGWDLPAVALVGIMDADSLLAIPDFKTDEKAFQIILQAAGRTGRPGARFPGIVIIQTFQPENAVLQTVARRDYAGFFEREIADRKILGLPPFTSLIRITLQDANRKKVEAETERVSRLLEPIANKDIVITHPLEPLVGKVRGRFRKDILLKLKKSAVPETLIKELNSLGSGWLIDRDPISIN